MEYVNQIILVLSFLIMSKLSTRFVVRYGEKKGITNLRISYINKTKNIIFLGFFILLSANLLGLEYTQLSIFLSSAFAVIGVALFAHWSIISNVTASVIIFFFFPYKVGDKIRVSDKDDDISGTIEEITLFHVLIRNEKGLIIYPNNLILQKAVIKTQDLPAEQSP